MGSEGPQARAGSSPGPELPAWDRLKQEQIASEKHINEIIGGSETAIKKHINEIISASETATKKHINEIISASERKIQNDIISSSTQLESNIRIQLDQFDQSSKFLLSQYILKTRDNTQIISPIDAELSVFSQWGEDGIIQWIINKITLENKYFVEFGVENYKESNTRFLLMNNNWSGLIVDSSKSAIDEIKQDSIFWKYDLTALCNFITTENINEIFKEAGISGDIGLLSIDIDGNDYWVWQAITAISPRIVICEYNSVFGCTHAITIPYTSDFDRTRAHFSNLYWGASLPALCMLAQQKGYVFISSNTAGNNAFFIRKDLASGFKELTAKEGYFTSKYRESRDVEGQLSYVSGDRRLNLIKDLPVLDISDNKIRTLDQLLANNGPE